MQKLSGQDYRTLALAALGGALEFYDFIIYVFFAVVIGKLFFPSDMPDWLLQIQVFGIFAAGYLARPLGGIVMAHFGDLLGRKRMFMLSIILMTVPTLAIGLLPVYAVIGIWAPLLLLAFRLMQGAAIGGEVPGAWVFVSEHVPARHIGFACGVLTAGLTGGILLGSLVAMAINKIYTPADPALQGDAGQAGLVQRAAAKKSAARSPLLGDSDDADDLAAVCRDRGDDTDDAGAAAKTVCHSGRGHPAGQQPCDPGLECGMRYFWCAG
jgi:MFS family permease